MLKEAVDKAENEQKATVFGYYVNDPERYGVAEFDADGNVFSIDTGHSPAHVPQLTHESEITYAIIKSSL